MNSKLHIDMSRGVLEVEGSDDLVREIFQQFRTELKEHKTSFEPANYIDTTPTAEGSPKLLTGDSVEQDKPSKPAKKKPAAGKKAKKTNYSLLKDLKTGMPNEDGSLSSYIGKYQPKSDLHRNVVLVKYLSEQHSGMEITLNHIFTCYSNAGLKLPKDLYMSVASSARSSNGYLDTSSMDDIKLAYPGEVLLSELEGKAKGV